MSTQVTTAFVQQYKTNVEEILQQRGSKLRNAVMVDSYVGKAGKAIEQMGPVTAQLRTVRHGDTPQIDMPHDARWVFPKDYEWADLIDDQDRLRMLIDPTSPYAENGAMALGRAIDSEIFAEMGSDTNKVGENGTTNKVFDTGMIVANTVGAGAATGMNIAKLRAGKRLLMSREVDVDTEMLFCTISALQHDELLGQTQAVSLDYNTRPTLVDGRITQFMGFNFIHTELTPKVTTDRQCYFWSKRGVHLGIWNDITTRISERDDKSYATQVYVKGTFGATRVQEGRVGRILCNDP